MKKPSPIYALAHTLNFGLSPCSSTQIEALMLMKAYVLGKDWRKNGVFPAVVAELLDGKEIVEIANLLNLEKRQVEAMIFRIDNALRGDFSDALFHYISGDAQSALQSVKALGFSPNRQLPVELYAYFQPRKGAYALEECAAEFNYVASFSLAHLNMPIGVDREKVNHILGILHSDDPSDMPDRFRLAQRLGEATRPYGWDHPGEPSAEEQG